MLDMRKSLSVVFGLIFSFLFNAVYLAVDTDAAETKITEEKVRAILKSMETAIIEGDVKGVTAHMALPWTLSSTSVISKRG
jgi:uncharacterized membrane-anchored protein